MEVRQGSRECSLEEAALRQSSVEGSRGTGHSCRGKGKGTGREAGQTRARENGVGEDLDLSGRRQRG